LTTKRWNIKNEVLQKSNNEKMKGRRIITREKREERERARARKKSE
jgi:hypothetical protein